MPNVDGFESVFRGAVKAVYRYAPVHYGRVLVVTDLAGEAAVGFGERVRGFLGVLGGRATVEVVAGDEYDSVQGLLDLVGQRGADVVCAYRNLKAPAKRWPYSLGEYVDVLTQVVRCPILLVPPPPPPPHSPHSPHSPATGDEDGDGDGELPGGTGTVMAMTDHLAGDDGLVNAALGLTAGGGRLLLSHVEDDAVFERYMGVISKIPDIDTATARESIGKQLLKEPHDYIGSCAQGVRGAGLDVRVEEVVTMGHHLDEYKRLVVEHGVDLLVMNTKDQDQMAMHGLAYPLAVEMRGTAMLLL